MSKANAVQVGGSHYKVSFEHWDLCHELDLGYFEGQITKYITRHRLKKGKEDAEKALHFCAKLTELARAGRRPCHKVATFARMSEYVAANNLMPIEYACINGACNWQFVGDLEALGVRIERLISECYPSARNAQLGHISYSADLDLEGEPDGRYTNQG